MAEQRLREMDAKQIRQRRIGAVKIHPRRIWRKQSRLIGRRCQIVVFARLVHLQPLFVSSRIAIISEKAALRSLTCSVK
jgi:hypothetical protein